MSNKKKLKFEVKEATEGIATVRLCSLERCNADDLEGECDQCHRPIFFRPEPPFLLKKLCLDCGMPLMAEESENTLICTPETLKEITSLIKEQPCKPGPSIPTPRNLTGKRK